MTARVVGLGQRYGGDDAVGLVVAERVRALGPPEGVEVSTITDTTDLVAAFATDAIVVLVDAIIGAGEPGRLHVVEPEGLDALGGQRLGAVSTHALNVNGALALAAVLDPEGRSPRVHVVGVAVGLVRRFSEGLSPAVAAAVEPAARAVLAIVERSFACRFGDRARARGRTWT